MRIQVWDTAYTEKKDNAASACITADVRPNGYYILEAVEHHVEFPELKNLVIAKEKHFKPDVVLIEDKASGISLNQELERNTKINLVKVRIGRRPKKNRTSIKKLNDTYYFYVDGDKIARAYSASVVVRSGNVFLLHNKKADGTFQPAWWVSNWLYVFSRFPAVARKDLVDCFSMLVAYSKWNKAKRKTIRRKRSVLEGGVPFDESIEWDDWTEDTEDFSNKDLSEDNMFVSYR